MIENLDISVYSGDTHMNTQQRAYRGMLLPACLHVCTHARAHGRACKIAKSLMLRSDDALTHGVSRCECIFKPWDKPTPEASDGGIHGQDQGLAGEDVCA